MEDILCNTAGALVFVLHYAAHALSGRSLLLDGIKRDFAPAGKAAPAAELPPQNADAAELPAQNAPAAELPQDADARAGGEREKKEA